jgi:hypothetical protein
MTSIAGSNGLASLQAAKQEGDAAFFANLMRNEEKREAAKKEAEVAEQKPVTINLGGNALTLSDEPARELTALLQSGASLFEASPAQVFSLPNGMTATGAELEAALSTLILAGKA